MLSEAHLCSAGNVEEAAAFRELALLPPFMKFSFAWLQNKLQNFQHVTFSKVVGGGGGGVSEIFISKPRNVFSCFVFSLLFSYDSCHCFCDLPMAVEK